MNLSTKRCWAEIDLGALRHNVAAIRTRLGGAGIMAVVKANAYGHGAPRVVAELDPLVEAFGVANLAEAAQIGMLVEAGRVFILGTALPAERAEIIARGFVPVISSCEEARAFEEFATEGPVSVTVAVDTGMGRIGIAANDILAELTKIAALSRIKIRSFATHLPAADEDDAFTRQQLAEFERIVAEVRAAGIRAPLVHVLNSAGAIQYPRHAADMARIGLALYGISPVPGFQEELRPVMTLKTRITLVRKIPAGHGVSYGRTFVTPRETTVATLAIGYADGYQRRLSGHGAEVLIAGRKCPLLGRVTMDQVMVDVTNLPDVQPGDEAVLFGVQQGQKILADDLAAKAGTIAWEVFTGISQRVERIWLNPAVKPPQTTGA